MQRLFDVVRNLASRLFFTSVSISKGRKSLRVFVVGCEAHVARLIEANLIRQGHTIIVCIDMNHATQLARQDPPHVVVLDFEGTDEEFHIMVLFHQRFISELDEVERSPFEKTRFLNIRSKGVSGILGGWPDDFPSGPTAGAVVTDR